MLIPTPSEGIHVLESAAWSRNWAWGIPLIMLTVVFHVAGLGIIRRVVRGHRKPPWMFTIAGATLWVCALHAIEASIWGAAYIWLGALPSPHIAMLYSLNAITSYGHITFDLQPHWQLMGAMEALNGWLLFGLTTAFLLGLITRAAESNGSEKASNS